jgi:predicted glycosyltransferase
MRAAQLDRWGRAIALEPVGLDSDRMAQAIETSLSRPTPTQPPVALDGLERAVHLFETLVARKEQTAAVG